MKKYLLLFLCSLIAFAYGEKYALLIGNSHYPNPEDVLYNPANDVTDLGRALQQAGFEVFTHYDLGQGEMISAITDFARKLSDDDIALFYFSGHGIQVDKQNYLVPIDADFHSLNAVRYSSVHADLVLAELNDAGSRVNIIILDACRNAPSINRSASKGSQSRGLADMQEVATGTLLAYATSPHKVAYDGTGRNSPYVEQLKKFIVRPELHIEEVFRQTRIAVVQATQDPRYYDQGPQQPEERSLLSGDVFLHGDSNSGSISSSNVGKRLTINSTPSGAAVYVDATYLGTTPLNNASIASNARTLSLRLEGYQEYHRNLPSGSKDIGVSGNDLGSIQLKINSPDELVRRARQGGTLHLAATTFRLSSTLELSGNVRLIGQGYQQTRIVSSAADYVVRYTGGGTFAAQGIGFEHTGNQKAHVVWVDNGTLDIDSCQFTGGKFDAEKVWGGVGLGIIGSTRGTVRNSLFNDNGLHGIQVDGNAQPRLEQNRLHDNTQAGIGYLGSAGGSAVGNESYGNGYHGIAVQENAQPRLEQNRLHDNTQTGIAYAGSAGGSAVGNESYGNGHHGIQVRDNAQPRLEQNRLHDNTEMGIRYSGSAGGSAVENESYGNGYHGIAIVENAQPRLEQNRLHDNIYSGIAYFHQSGGSARNNQSYSNGTKGIYVESTANPSLSNNTTYGNRQGDIVDQR